MESHNESLHALGWGSWQDDALREAFSSLDYVPARVVRQERGWLGLDTGSRHLRAMSSGRMRHKAARSADLPIIGDWVMVSAGSADGATVIVDIVPRKTVLLRRRAGAVPGAQPLAANVDVALIVVGMDRELNLGLIERALVVAQVPGVEAILVPNKLDLCSDGPARAAELCAGFPALRVLPVSARSGEGIGLLRAALGPGRTAVLLGASGVGKSSLVNHLFGTHAMKTGAVRADDRKGYHTTTHRQLFVLPGGALLIDGPGIRELGVWGTSAEAVDLAFPDIREAASRCTHRSCQHRTEVGCAVRSDVLCGRIAAKRLEDYLKLRQEILHSAASRPRRGRT